MDALNIFSKIQVKKRHYASFLFTYIQIQIQIHLKYFANHRPLRILNV